VSENFDGDGEWRVGTVDFGAGRILEVTLHIAGQIAVDVSCRVRRQQMDIVQCI